jgi:hypothetical protein
MSRDKQSFEQLINYIDKDYGQEIIHNFLDKNQEYIINEFLENSKYIEKSKGKNYLYHEVISLSENKLSLKKQQEILIKIGQEYINKRAKNNLVFGKIHLEKNNIHLHLCISANELFNDRRHFLTKKEFLNIQKEMETFIEKNYSNLKEPKIYNKDLTKTISRKEQERKQRTNKISKKDLVKNRVIEILQQSKNRDELNNNLEKECLEIYKNGNTIGVKNSLDSKKYRLKTLNILDDYDKFNKKISEIESRKNELKKVREIIQNRDLGLERER